VILSGHAHYYERFARQRPDGTKDLSRGIREFVVGTGRAPPVNPMTSPRAANSVVDSEISPGVTAYGVLRLRLSQAVTLGNSSQWRERPSPTQAPANAPRLLAGRTRSQVSEAGHGRARRRIERAVDLIVLLVDLRPVCIGFGNLLSQSHNGSRLAHVGVGA
jgi:hypothetical protein